MVNRNVVGVGKNGPEWFGKIIRGLDDQALECKGSVKTELIEQIVSSFQ